MVPWFTLTLNCLRCYKIWAIALQLNMIDMALKNRKGVTIFPLLALFTCMPPSPQRHWLKFNSSLWRSNSGDIDRSCSIQNKLLRINNSRLSCPYLVGHSPRCHFDLDTKFRTRFNQYEHGIKQLEIAAFDHPLEFGAVVCFFVDRTRSAYVPNTAIQFRPANSMHSRIWPSMLSSLWLSLEHRA